MNPDPVIMKTRSETLKIILWHMTLDTAFRCRNWTRNVGRFFGLVALDTIGDVFRFTYFTDRSMRIVTSGTPQSAI